MSMRSFALAIIAVVSTSSARAYWPPKFEASFDGQCVRPDHQPVDVSLVLAPQNSSFAKRAMIDPDIDQGTVTFRSPGISAGEQVQRDVVAKLQPDFTTVLVKITQADGKWADCTLQATPVSP